MLRVLVLALVLLNGIYFAWGQGWLLSYGFGPVSQREPQRLGQQIKPEALVLLSAQEVDKYLSAATAAPGHVQCLQAGLLDDTQSKALRRVLEQSLPQGTWTLEAIEPLARWIVYMGKYANVAELDKKRAQLASLRLKFEPLTNSELAPGLSLGVFETQAAANAALDALTRRGVRTARVLQDQKTSSLYNLRLPAVDDALLQQLGPVRAALAGKALVACP
jgi:hypothetical protein